MPVQAVVFAGDAPVDHAAEISRRSSVPVIFDVYGELEHPTLQAFVSAVTEPISASASALATTNFETLCASKPLSINHAFFDESRARKL